jgi:hypothetical protein
MLAAPAIFVFTNMKTGATMNIVKNARTNINKNENKKEMLRK